MITAALTCVQGCAAHHHHANPIGALVFIAGLILSQVAMVVGFTIAGKRTNRKDHA